MLQKTIRWGVEKQHCSCREQTLLQTDFTIICKLGKKRYKQLLEQRTKQEMDAVQSNDGVESIAAANDVSICLKNVAGHPLGHEDVHIGDIAFHQLCHYFISKI